MENPNQINKTYYKELKGINVEKRLDIDFYSLRSDFSRIGHELSSDDCLRYTPHQKREKEAVAKYLLAQCIADGIAKIQATKWEGKNEAIITLSINYFPRKEDNLSAIDEIIKKNGFESILGMLHKEKSQNNQTKE